MASNSSLIPAERSVMSSVVDFKNVSTVGLESSPHADALAGLRGNQGPDIRSK